MITSILPTRTRGTCLIRASLAKIVLMISGNPADRRVTDASDNELSLHRTFTYNQQNTIQVSSEKQSSNSLHTYGIGISKAFFINIAVKITTTNGLVLTLDRHYCNKFGPRTCSNITNHEAQLLNVTRCACVCTSACLYCQSSKELICRSLICCNKATKITLS